MDGLTASSQFFFQGADRVQLGIPEKNISHAPERGYTVGKKIFLTERMMMLKL
jgi:hypothetical protein